MTELELCCDGPRDAQWTMILAHGTGQGMGSEFMEYFAKGLAGQGLRSVRFDFPYMRETGRDGKRRPPDREPVLRAAWRQAIGQVVHDGASRDRLIIGGKSLGGHIASLVADDEKPARLICLGYPFHPPGKPERLRTAHLEEIRTPTLICQGARDSFGNEEDVSSYRLSTQIRFCWLPDGDHGFKPRKASGLTREHNWDLALASILEFIRG